MALKESLIQQLRTEVSNLKSKEKEFEGLRSQLTQLEFRFKQDITSTVSYSQFTHLKRLDLEDAEF
jgi:signal transduction histidine kinase